MTDPLDKCILMDNALSKEDYDLCMQIINFKGRKGAEEYKIETGTSYLRWYPDPNTEIVKILGKLLWSDKVMKEASDLDDLAWKLFVGKRAGNFELGVTFYNNINHSYLWHVDHLDKAPDVTRPRVLNYILYMNEVEGGALDLSDDYSVTELCSTTKDYHVAGTVIPTMNRLVIMPSWIPHRVNVTWKGERITINGHITL